MSVTLEKESTGLRCKLAADSAVDSETGIIRGCTVMKANVPAIGKVVMLDSQGRLTRDEKLAVKKLPVFTDAKTLETLMTAAAEAGKRIKVREDHNDDIGARAGFSNAFQLIAGDRVTADLHLFKSYRNRAVMLETADQTPEEIGLSIDFDPEYELAADKALMRVKALHAVDIVDEGAVTPGGLLLHRGVDTAANNNSAADTTAAQLETEKNMASPTLDEIMSAVGALKGQIDACTAALSKLSAAPAPDAMTALRTDNEKLTASIKEQGELLKSVVASQAAARKERALLGFKGNDAERVRLAAGSAEDIEAAIAGKKNYLELVAAARAADSKLSAGDAHDKVRKTPEGAAAYEEHLLSRGVATREQLKAERAA